MRLPKMFGWTTGAKNYIKEDLLCQVMKRD
ncbi:hypothetical protein ES703_64054 [subsurface metagenome]